MGGRSQPPQVRGQQACQGGGPGWGQDRGWVGGEGSTRECPRRFQAPASDHLVVRGHARISAAAAGAAAAGGGCGAPSQGCGLEAGRYGPWELAAAPRDGPRGAGDCWVAAARHWTGRPGARPCSCCRRCCWRWCVPGGPRVVGRGGATASTVLLVAAAAGLPGGSTGSQALVRGVLDGCCRCCIFAGPLAVAVPLAAAAPVTARGC